MTRVAGVIFLVLSAAFGAAHAQCFERWLPGEADSTISGYVRECFVWDPDGAGPQAPQLLMGGHSLLAGGQNVVGLAWWDGARWRTMGLAGNIAALVVFQGDLIAAGSSLQAGGQNMNNIARWNGSQWLPLGVGVGGINQGVKDLAVYAGELYAAGEFQSAGGNPAARVARWNGTGWLPLGSGVNGTASALCAMPEGLFIGGSFSTAGGLTSPNLAVWNGAWSAAPAPVDGPVTAMLNTSAGLIAGTTQGSEARVVRWDGAAWEELARAQNSGNPGAVYELAEHQGQLYAGGYFNTIGGVAAVGIARWDGTAWQSTDANLYPGPYPNVVSIDGIATYEGDLIVAGSFAGVDGIPLRSAARLRDTRWGTIGEGFDAWISALLPTIEGVYAAGAFNWVGAEPAPRIARWDGSRWLAVGGGIQGDEINALVEFDGDVIAGGDFHTAGGTPAGNIARWDGVRWSPIGELPGWGDESPVNALTVYNNELIAAGSARMTPLSPGRSVVRWDGVAWRAIGGEFDGPVYALAVFGGDLYAGGNFNTVGGAPARGLARWTGSQWSNVAENWLDVFVLCADEETLYVGGAFSFTDGDGVPVRHLGLWDGAQWAGLSISPDGPVYGLARRNGTIYASGHFANVGRRISRYTPGVGWNSMSLGIASTMGAPYAIAVWNDEILVGGHFITAGDLPSGFFARWTDNNTPWIAHHPADAAASLRVAASFTVIPAPGYDPLTFRWQMHDPPVPGEWRDLADGPLVIAGQEVASLSGAAGATLSITPTVNFGGMTLRAVVSNDCGEAVSAPAVLTVSNCDPDLNCDGSADQGDLACLVLALAGDASCFCQSDPDFNLDGSADQGDVAAVISVVAGGECP